MNPTDLALAKLPVLGGTGGFENLIIEKEWTHHYKIMMAAKKL